MSYEHHGDCCQTHDHHPHTAAIQQLSRACCLGACNHADHVGALRLYESSSGLKSESIFGDNTGVVDKKKKKKLGSFSIGLFNTGAEQANLAQLS